MKQIKLPIFIILFISSFGGLSANEHNALEVFLLEQTRPIRPEYWLYPVGDVNPLFPKLEMAYSDSEYTRVKLSQCEVEGENKIYISQILIDHFYCRNGKLHGEYKTYFVLERKRTQLRFKANFLKGKLNGKSWHFSPFGYLERVHYYRDGKLHGESQFYRTKISYQINRKRQATKKLKTIMLFKQGLLKEWVTSRKGNLIFYHTDRLNTKVKLRFEKTKIKRNIPRTKLKKITSLLERFSQSELIGRHHYVRVFKRKRPHRRLIWERFKRQKEIFRFLPEFKYIALDNNSLSVFDYSEEANEYKQNKGYIKDRKENAQKRLKNIQQLLFDYNYQFKGYSQASMIYSFKAKKLHALMFSKGHAIGLGFSNIEQARPQIFYQGYALGLYTLNLKMGLEIFDEKKLVSPFIIGGVGLWLSNLNLTLAKSKDQSTELRVGVGFTIPFWKYYENGH